MTDSIWTPELHQALADALAAGLSYSQVGAALGITASAALSRAKRTGLKSKNMPCINAGQRRRKAGSGDHTPESKRIPLEKTTVMQCRFPLWPHDTDGRPDFVVCGNRTGAIGDPYCEHHATVCMPGHSRAKTDDRAKSKEAARITGSTRIF